MSALRVCMRWKGLYYAILFSLVGYALAVASLQVESWIDFSSGSMETRVKVFPFSKTLKRGDRAFDMFFRGEADKPPAWELVGVSGFANPFGLHVSYPGETLLYAENLVVEVLRIQPLSLSERQRIAQEFFGELHSGGPSAAAAYADRLVESVMERNAAEFGKP